MKKIFLLFSILFWANFVCAQEMYDISPYNTQLSSKEVGIAKYAVLEVTKNYTPIRKNPNENAQRMTHLFKNCVLFSDKQTKDYYRVEFEKVEGEPTYYWVNKKYVEVQGIIPEKRFEEIKKITFKNEKDRFKIKIDTNTKGAFIINETQNENGYGLDFTLYDNHFDPTNIKIINKNKYFTISDKIENKLEISYFSPRPLFGYGVADFEDGYIYTIKKSPKISYKKPLKNMTIVVDPGHGGVEKGACAFNLEEKNINLQISKKLKKELSKQGAKVYLTRNKDVLLPLYDRVDFAREKDADILLSIHQNSLPDIKYIDKKHGVGTYYYNEEAKELANSIKNSLVLSTGFRDDGCNNASFALNRPTEFLSVLIECGYIIKKDEALKLSDKNFQKVVAKGIVSGIEDYLRKAYFRFEKL